MKKLSLLGSRMELVIGIVIIMGIIFANMGITQDKSQLASRVEELIKQLDSDDFNIRQKAEAQIRLMDNRILPEIREFLLSGTGSVEQNTRLQKIYDEFNLLPVTTNLELTAEESQKILEDAKPRIEEIVKQEKEDILRETLILKKVRVYEQYILTTDELIPLELLMGIKKKPDYKNVSGEINKIIWSLVSRSNKERDESKKKLLEFGNSCILELQKTLVLTKDPGLKEDLIALLKKILPMVKIEVIWNTEKYCQKRYGYGYSFLNETSDNNINRNDVQLLYSPQSLRDTFFYTCCHGDSWNRAVNLGAKKLHEVKIPQDKERVKWDDERRNRIAAIRGDTYCEEVRDKNLSHDFFVKFKILEANEDYMIIAWQRMEK